MFTHGCFGTDTLVYLQDLLQIRSRVGHIFAITKQVVTITTAAISERSKFLQSA